jgi:dipeptidase E
MNLVFLSDQLTRDNDETDCAIADLLEERNNPTILYIPSQADTNRYFYSRAVSYYARLGIQVADYFDLETGYDSGRIDEMFQVGAVHLSGGSTYHFLQNLQNRNFLSVLQEFAAGGGVLIGVSAGALLMTQHIEASLLYGDPFIEGLDTRALSLVDWEFFPHLKSMITEDQVIAYSLRSEKRILSCEDGEGIVVTGQGIRYIGNISVFHKGSRQLKSCRE